MGIISIQWSCLLTVEDMYAKDANLDAMSVSRFFCVLRKNCLTVASEIVDPTKLPLPVIRFWSETKMRMQTLDLLFCLMSNCRLSNCRLSKSTLIHQSVRE